MNGLSPPAFRFRSMKAADHGRLVSASKQSRADANARVRGLAKASRQQQARNAPRSPAGHTPVPGASAADGQPAVAGAPPRETLVWHPDWSDNSDGLDDEDWGDSDSDGDPSAAGDHRYRSTAVWGAGFTMEAHQERVRAVQAATDALQRLQALVAVPTPGPPDTRRQFTEACAVLQKLITVVTDGCTYACRAYRVQDEEVLEWVVQQMTALLLLVPWGLWVMPSPEPEDGAGHSDPSTSSRPLALVDYFMECFCRVCHDAAHGNFVDTLGLQGDVDRRHLVCNLIVLALSSQGTLCTLAVQALRTCGARQLWDLLWASDAFVHALHSLGRLVLGEETRPGARPPGYGRREGDAAGEEGEDEEDSELGNAVVNVQGVMDVCIAGMEYSDVRTPAVTEAILDLVSAAMEAKFTEPAIETLAHYAVLADDDSLVLVIQRGLLKHVQQLILHAPQAADRGMCQQVVRHALNIMGTLIYRGADQGLPALGHGAGDAEGDDALETSGVPPSELAVRVSVSALGFAVDGYPGLQALLAAMQAEWITRGSVLSPEAGTFTEDAMLYIADMLCDIASTGALAVHTLDCEPGRAVFLTLCRWLRAQDRVPLRGDVPQRLAFALVNLVKQLHDIAQSLLHNPDALAVISPVAGEAVDAAHHLLLTMQPDNMYYSLMEAYSALQAMSAPPGEASACGASGEGWSAPS